MFLKFALTSWICGISFIPDAIIKGEVALLEKSIYT